MRSAANLCVLLSLVVPATASAQDPSANDPATDSPAGAVYELPLDSARQDGAPRPDPKPSQDGKGTARAAPETPSSIRSENRFGSSSRVPGVDEQASKRPPATAAVATPVAAAEDDEGGSSGPSLPLILLLVGLLVVVGAGSGTLAARSRRS